MIPLERDRKTMRDTLLAAGWQVSDRGKFGDRAFLEYNNGKLSLEVEEGQNESKNRYFRFIVSPGFAQGLYLNVHFDDDDAKLADALKLIVSFQNEISPSNFKGYVRGLLKVCPKIFLDLEELDHLVRLVDDETLGIPAIDRDVN
jgi:hypothetical protein